MKVMGIDYGKARIGIAISDALGILATPLGNIEEKHFPTQVEKTLKVIFEHKPQKVIVGLPKNMDGTVGESAEIAKEFGQRLSESGVEIMYRDERLSTVSAHKIMNEVGMRGSGKRRKIVDTISAVVILQSYLDENV